MTIQTARDFARYAMSVGANRLASQRRDLATRHFHLTRLSALFCTKVISIEETDPALLTIGVVQHICPPASALRLVRNGELNVRQVIGITGSPAVNQG